MSIYDGEYHDGGEVGAPADGGVFDSGFTLEEIAARGGCWSELAAELVAAREDREKRAAHERLIAEAETALEAEEELDLSNPAVLEALRAEGQAVIDAGNAQLRAKTFEKNLDFHGAEAAAQLADRAVSDISWFDASSDPIHHSPTYQEHEHRQFEAERGRQGAYRSQENYGLAEAEAYIAQMKARERERHG